MVFECLIRLEQVVNTMVPLLARQLGEHFNIFRVMHHGTHEKQLSNVFGWLLQSDGTHGLGDAFQGIFLDQVNAGLSEESRLARTGYRVSQEVDTSGHEALGKDIADIVLTGKDACLVVENFEVSDGHGHSYQRYLEHGSTGGKRSVVVLLCARHEPTLQKAGWEHAIVITYATLLNAIQAYIGKDAAWRRAHPRQLCLINDLRSHFTGGDNAVSNEDRIAFLKTMCETGESSRYGHRPQEAAAKEFATQMAQQAQRQFEEGRRTLAQVKKSLKRFADHTLTEQVNASLREAQVTEVQARFVGQWEWCVTLYRADLKQSVFLEFGPSAVAENARAPEPLESPDYSMVFVTRSAGQGGNGIDQILQTAVSLSDVLAGLSQDDVRLRDAVIAVIER